MDKIVDKAKLEKCLKRNYYYAGREWPYKNVKPQIIAEKYMVDEIGTELKDYKIFNFNGEPKIIQLDYNRFVEHKRKLYSVDWEPINATFIYGTDENDSFVRPRQLHKMLELSKLLSKGKPFVRTDFYYINDRIYFGEITFYPESGFGKVTPKQFDEKMGEWIQLPKK